MAARLAGTERVRQRMLADLAHELRTPFASIEATAEAIADGVLPADATTCATLTDQAARLGRLVADIAAVSHAEERSLYAEPRSCAPGELAAAAVAAIQPQYAAKGVRLTLIGGSDAPTVTADADRLGEALTNLLDNALRHTPSGGTVTVAVTRGARLGRSVALLTVTDTGEGFDPTEADRLTERFYRADAARTRDGAGSGIGLTITKAIVTAHGGTLRASSLGTGRGATFQVTLPAA